MYIRRYALCLDDISKRNIFDTILVDGNPF